jgi:Family of unknown function (DUF6220)
MRGTLIQEVDEVTTTRATTPPSNVEASLALPAASNRMARTHRYFARVLLGGIAVQYFFAGLGVFGITSFLPHVIFGSLVVIASFGLPIIAWRGHLAKSVQRRSWLLSGLMILQGGLIDAGRVIPLVSAFHPVNALLIALITFTLI